MQDQLKEYGLNLGQVIILFALLIIPQSVGVYIIPMLGVTEVMHYLDIFLVMAGITVAYYAAMMFFHGRLINRINDLVYVKYLVVIIILFWIVYDGYMAFIFQKAYMLNESTIIRRDIVWRDITFEELPYDVIYPNFRVAYLFCLSAARGILVAVLAYSLMTEKKEPQLRTKSTQRKKVQNKSIEELKAGLHPSILKKYQDEKKQNE